MVGVASVQDLQQDLAALVVHAGVTRRCRRASERHHLRGERQQPAGAVRRIATGDDEPDAAPRAFGEVRGQPVDVARPVFEPGVHRTHDHPVAQRGEPEVQG